MIRHRKARDLTPAWHGRRITVTTDGATVTGGLSDVGWVRDTGQVRLYVGGRIVDVHPDTTVTEDRTGGRMLGGVA